MKTMIIVEGFNHSESDNQKNHSADDVVRVDGGVDCGGGGGKCLNC